MTVRGILLHTDRNLQNFFINASSVLLRKPPPSRNGAYGKFPFMLPIPHFHKFLLKNVGKYDIIQGISQIYKKGVSDL